ncbi:type i inositol 1 4 5-trisphosphate 5-phosphatase cvp2 [Phtheirospermum japonicum]|uniref:Type i inositol 1 4 5-trisphosphate 5-phosphatase cvp2 n=1 Tax=Phtheirospermum japonicum TaxID=374723 RepID=A0A830CZ79_9LAMI|nr:type i inositol 1 4 5-trisphosphate 5-phosphatase cvp2 [Phtheirospermum japonicum]
MAYGMHAPAEDGCFGPGQLRYSLVTSEQMVGVFLTVWVGSELMHVRNRKVSCVRRGLMCSLGNKVALTPAHACGAFLYIRIYLTKKKTRFPQVRGGDKEKSPETILEHKLQKALRLGAPLAFFNYD